MAAAGQQAHPVELECSVCCDLLTDPRTLACTHTFCMSCLVQLFQTLSKGNMVDCPLCRQVTEIEDGDLSSLPSNTAIGTAVGDFQKTVDTIRARAETKIATLIEHVCLINDAEEAVTVSHERAFDAIEQAFEETLLKLSESREELVAKCRRRRQEGISVLNVMREPAVNMINRISSASDGISDDAKQLVEDEIMAAHESACVALDNILDVADPDGTEANALVQDAGDFEFLRHKGENHELRLGTFSDPKSKTVSDGKMQLLCEFSLSDNKVADIALTPDDRIAIGYRTGGIELFSEGPREKVLHDVQVWALTVLTDGRFVIRDRDNCIHVYTSEFEKQNVEFSTLCWLSGGLGSIDSDRKDIIYVSYWLAELIQVFSPDGGTPIREISCDGFTPSQMSVMKYNGSLILSDGPTVRIVDESGEVQHEVSRGGAVGCPAVMDGDGDVLIAWINDSENLVSFEMYPPTLHDSLPMLAGYKTEGGWPGRCHLLMTNRSQVAFCRASKLHIFCFPSGAPCCIL